MRETAEELQISVQSSSRPESEGGLQPPVSSPDPLHLQDPQQDLQVQDQDPQQDLQIQDQNPQQDLQVQDQDPQQDLQVQDQDPQQDLQVQDQDPQQDLQVQDQDPQQNLQVPQPDLQVQDQDTQQDLQVQYQEPQQDLQVQDQDPQQDLQVQDQEPQQDAQVQDQEPLHLQVSQPDLQIRDSDLQIQDSDLQVQDPDLQVQVDTWRLKHGRLLLLFLSVYLLCVSSLGLIYFLYFHSNAAGSVTPCQSSACQAASVRLSSSIDPFERPCHHFLLSCGSEKLLQDPQNPQSQGQSQDQSQDQDQGTAKSQSRDEERPDRKPRAEEVVERKTLLLLHLRGALESSAGGDGSAVQKAKAFYRSCLDTGSLERRGAEPFLNLVQQLGGWAVSGSWTRPDFNWTLSSLMRDFSTFPFFNLYVGQDPRDTEPGPAGPRTYIQIDQPDLLIPIQWNSKTQKSEAKTERLRPFLASCQRYLALLGAPASSSMIHVGIFTSLSSELAVAASPLEYRLENGRLHHRTTIRELQRQAPAIDWLGCLRAAFQPLSLGEDEPVLLHNLPYIVHMSRIITRWLHRDELSSSGPLHTFMILNLLHTLMPAMDSRFSETARTFSEALGNTDKEVPRWRRCVLETERGFGSVLAHLLREREAGREVEEELVHHVLSSLKTQLAQVEWSDQQSLHSLRSKVGSLSPRLWTSEMSSEVELDQKFSEVTVSGRGFFSNYVQMLSLCQRRRRGLLRGRSLTPDVLSVTPALRGHELLVPVGLFIPPFFHPSFPRAMNYGATGFLLAKDLLHLLLPEVFSGSAVVRSVSGCVWSHYLRVTAQSGAPGASEPSAAQQLEVWVQYAALQVALEAYRRSLEDHPVDSSLLGRSNTHLFLTSFSQISCDSDPSWDLMPLPPSFLIPVICARLDLCSPSLRCSLKSPNNRSEPC